MVNVVTTEAAWDEVTRQLGRPLSVDEAASDALAIQRVVREAADGTDWRRVPLAAFERLGISAERIELAMDTLVHHGFLELGPPNEAEGFIPVRAGIR